MIFFLLKNTKEALKNVNAALFHYIKVNGDQGLSSSNKTPMKPYDYF